MTNQVFDKFSTHQSTIELDYDGSWGPKSKRILSKTSSKYYKITNVINNGKWRRI